MAQLELTTAGESHGPELSAILTGIPSGMPVDRAVIDAQLRRRQSGHGRSPRQQIERDEVIVVGGVRHGKAMGSPIAMRLPNRDHSSWDAVMAPWPTDQVQGNWRDQPVQLVRPGHADLGGIARGGFAEDGLRPVLERASARETAARVAAGSIAQQFLAQLGVRVRGYVRGVGDVRSEHELPDEDDACWDGLDTSALRTIDADAEGAMVAAIDAARADRDTLGGVVDVVVWGMPPGVGGYVTAQERLDGRLAGAVLAVHAMKSVTVGGDESRSGGLRGSATHDEIFPEDDATRERPTGALGGPHGMGVTRRSNRAGGIEGGMTTGAPVVLQVTMKPLPTLMRPLASVDLATGAAAQAHAERSDTCAIAAGAVALETAVAFEIARVVREQFGAQAMEDVRGAFTAYCERVRYPHRPPVVLT